MKRSILISVDDDVVDKFDNAIGINKRSTYLNEMMKTEVKRRGGTIE